MRKLNHKEANTSEVLRRGLLALVGALLLAGPAAALDPAERCEADKCKETGKYQFCRMKEEARALKKGITPSFSKCDQKLTARWSLIESKAGGACPANGDQMAISSRVAAQTDLLTLLLSGGTPVGCPLPATGQTTSYTSGDDGHVQAGAALSYLDNGDGTITDLNTGLMWEKKSNDGGIHHLWNDYCWDPAACPGFAHLTGNIFEWVDELNNQAFAGHTDWRIPNYKELVSILDLEGQDPTVAPVFNTGTSCWGTPGCTVLTCSCTADWYYWTSTSHGDSDSAWQVNCWNGVVGPRGKSNGASTRAVRGP
jgi:hypothetical protein